MINWSLSFVKSGELVDYIPHGQGVAKYTNGDLFEGIYNMGSKEGQGLYKFANGASYEGGYVGNVREGHGIMNYPDHSCYEGIHTYM